MHRTPSLRKIKNEPEPGDSPVAKLLKKRAIDADLSDLREVVADVVVEYLEGAIAGQEPSEVLTRTEAAAYLRMSLGQLDVLCRREHDPIPYTLAGDSKRFFRGDLRDWLRRQRAVKP
jgi:hypothetical protein